MGARRREKLSYLSVFVLLFVAIFLCVCQDSEAARGRRRGGANLVNSKQGFLNDFGFFGLALRNGSVGLLNHGFGGFHRGGFGNSFFNFGAIQAALQTNALSNLRPAIDVGGLSGRVPTNFGAPNQGGLGPQGSIAGPQPFDQNTAQRQDIVPVQGTANLGIRQGGDGRLFINDPATGKLVEAARVNGGGFVLNGSIQDAKAKEEFDRFSRQGIVGQAKDNFFRRGN